MPGCSTCGKRRSSTCKGTQCGVPDFGDGRPTSSGFSVSLVQAPPPARPSELIACSPDTGFSSGATASRTRQGFQTRSCVRGDTAWESAGVAVLPGKPKGVCGETSKQQEITGKWQIQSQHPEEKGCRVFEHEPVSRSGRECFLFGTGKIKHPRRKFSESRRRPREGTVWACLMGTHTWAGVTAPSRRQSFLSPFISSTGSQQKPTYLNCKVHMEK